MGSHVEVILLSPAPVKDDEDAQREATSRNVQDQELWRQAAHTPLESKCLTRRLTLPSLEDKGDGRVDKEVTTGKGESGANEEKERERGHEEPNTETKGSVALADAKSQIEKRRVTEDGHGRVVRLGGASSVGGASSGEAGRQGNPRSIITCRSQAGNTPTKGTTQASFSGQSTRTSSAVNTGHKRHKTNSSCDTSQSFTQRKLQCSDVTRTTNTLTLSSNVTNRGSSSVNFGETLGNGVNRKTEMRRNSQSKGTKLAPPEGRGSRVSSPDHSDKKSPSSGRSSPSNSKSPTDLDEKAKSFINKSSDTDKFAGRETEEGGKSKGGASGGSTSEPSAAPPSHPRPSKPPVEDRALQAILAARRRSLENAGKPEPES
ncbi:dentin sialophosphoprotein-like isoform X2 [Cherax quadricarinatus]|uniref:dentin sialophosphoprotein-like isoform X2 n=1 Tax=Cherax quadricarinatus TaxID=27406 RepID=UPI00387E657A